jgi:hypothetical protein
LALAGGVAATAALIGWAGYPAWMVGVNGRLVWLPVFAIVLAGLWLALHGVER